MDAAERSRALARLPPSLRDPVSLLSSTRGPNRLPGQVPSDDAFGLAYALAARSLAPLCSALLKGGGGAVTREGWRLYPPNSDDLPPQAGWGLPLLAACSRDTEVNALDALAHRVDGLANPELKTEHGRLRERLAEAITVELRLWMTAADEGGPSPRIPYAFQFLALEWFWTPKAHAGKLHAPAVCLRCGSMWFPYRPVEPPPRCAHCSNEPARAREWPQHAFAPDLRGQWWLRCQTEGCERAFVGRRNRMRCDECDLSRLARRKRPPRRAA
jgi:hypothetical protein